MPVRKRNLARRGALTPHEIAWLEGNRDCGFVKFKRPEELQVLFDTYGDAEAFVFVPPMRLPEPI